ncbi:hypothetical protein Tco_0759974 [Tanacetum coccineum]
MEAYPHLDNGIYDIVDQVMRPLALKQTRRPRSDRGKARHSVSSSSSHHHGTSSHQHDDDDDVETSRASTPSPTTYQSFLQAFLLEIVPLPDVLFLESWQPAWSASAKSVRLKAVSLGYHRPILMVPFSFFEYLHYELPEDVVSIIFGIILELQHNDCLV